MLVTKERIEGHYEVKEAPFGTDYVWVEGEEEVERRLLEEILHPWRATYTEWINKERAHPECQEQMELEALQ
jgi:hypothetical protein